MTLKALYGKWELLPWGTMKYAYIKLCFSPAQITALGKEVVALCGSHIDGNIGKLLIGGYQIAKGLKAHCAYWYGTDG